MHIDNVFKSYTGNEFTLLQIQELSEKIKDFNAGFIDKNLNAYVDKTFEEWLKKNS
jgi:hypothetical protein